MMQLLLLCLVLTPTLVSLFLPHFFLFAKKDGYLFWKMVGGRQALQKVAA
jgi:hypothetical protein